MKRSRDRQLFVGECGDRFAISSGVQIANSVGAEVE
jgi:hypothetical protein